MSLVRNIAIAATLLATSTNAGPVSFASGWSVQKLSFFSNNSYSFGNQLNMSSDGSVSIAWARLPTNEWGAKSASWSWAVDTSVPATNLRVKGVDDRNLSLYFVFLPEAEAASMEGAGIRQLLRNENVRVLLYTWGGTDGRGASFASPYLNDQGQTIILRPAGTGSHTENVDLAGDYARAFGGSAGALVGLAVSGDSDDTDSTISAAIANLSLN
jgi:hypothetical protein